MNKQGKTTIQLGLLLTLVVLTYSIYIMIPETVKLDVQPTYTKFYVWENNAWQLGATEYVYLYDGSTKMLANSRNINYSTDGKITKIIRTAIWKDNITTIDTYTFDSESTNIELFPISHTLQCINCLDKIVMFEYKDIIYDGITADVSSPQSYGRKMKIEWENGAYYAKVFQLKTSPDKLDIKYKPTSNDVTYNVRMFDPDTFVTNSASLTQYFSKNYPPIGYCNVTDSLNTMDAFNYTWYVNGVANYSGTSYYKLMTSPASSSGISFKRITDGSRYVTSPIIVNPVFSSSGIIYSAVTGYTSGHILSSNGTLYLSSSYTSDSTVFSQIANSNLFGCAIRRNDSRVMCWGTTNTYGQQGVGDTTTSTVPRLINDTRSYVLIRTSTYHTCGITTAGDAVCWGRGTEHQIGDGSDSNRYNPTNVAGGYKFKDLDTAIYSVCAITTANESKCWGSNYYYQLGLGFSDTGYNVPKNTTNTQNFSYIVSGYKHTCGLLTNGSVFCWGLNDYYQLGDGTNVSNGNGKLVPLNGTFKSIGSAYYGTCAVRINDSSLWCWGGSTTASTSAIHQVNISGTSIMANSGDLVAVANFNNFNVGDNVSFSCYAIDNLNSRNSSSVTSSSYTALDDISISVSPSSGSIYDRYTNVNVSYNINVTSPNTIIFNGTEFNYPLYDNSLLMMLGFNNITALGESTTVVKDYSPYKWNFTMSSTYFSYVDGKVGKALQNTGFGTTIGISTSVEQEKLEFLNQSFTTSSWIKFDTTSWVNGYPVMMKKEGDPGTGRTGWSIFGFNSSKEIHMELWNAGNHTGSDINIPVPSGGWTMGKWYHIVFVIDKTNMRGYGYRDGVLVINTTLTRLPGNTTNTQNFYVNNQWNGPVDEVLIYNRTLSSSEISALYTGGFYRLSQREWTFNYTDLNSSVGTYNHSMFINNGLNYTTTNSYYTTQYENSYYFKSIPYFNNFSNATENGFLQTTDFNPVEYADSSYYKSSNVSYYAQHYGTAGTDQYLILPYFSFTEARNYDASFWLRVKSEVDYDGCYLEYRLLNETVYTKVTDSTSVVRFKTPESTYDGYGSNTSIGPQWSYDDKTYDKINLTINGSALLDNKLVLRVVSYENGNTICSSAPCGCFVDDINISTSNVAYGTKLVEYTFTSSLNASYNHSSTIGFPINYMNLNTLEYPANYGYSSDPEIRVVPPSGATSCASAKTSDSYFFFYLNISSSKQVDLTGVSMLASKGGTSDPRGLCMYTSKDGYTTPIFDENMTTVRPNWTELSKATSVSGMTGMTEFRIYVYAPSTTTSLEVDNITLYGTINDYVYYNYTDYSDVLIITNNQSNSSINITNAFLAAHPTAKRLNISVSNTETITFSTFNTSIRQPIENYLTSNNLVNNISYIVLTKGVPIRYSGDATCRQGSVDSTLTIILSHYNSSICSGSTTYSGRVSNPMFSGSERGDKENYDIYMVTRLDGYTDADAIRLINSSVLIPISGKILLDRRPDKTSSYLIWDERMIVANAVITSYNYSTIYDDTNTFQLNKNNLSGYVSWGSNDGNASANSSTWNLSFNKGSIGETAVSTSGRSFAIGTTYGQSLIADLIAMNISGVKGYVYEPYLSAVAYPEILYDRYLTGYTLAESFYMSSNYINWQDIVIGDPKLAVMSRTTTDEPEINETPSNGTVVLTPSISTCGLINAAGSYYLTANITAPIDTTCIIIESDNVTLDCMGYTITGKNSTSRYAVQWYDKHKYVTVKNCNLVDWKYVINTYDVTYANITNITATSGMDIETTNFSSISDITITPKLGYCFTLYDSHYNDIRNVVAIATTQEVCLYGDQSYYNNFTNMYFSMLTSQAFDDYRSSYATIRDSTFEIVSGNAFYEYSSAATNMTFINTTFKSASSNTQCLVYPQYGNNFKFINSTFIGGSKVICPVKGVTVTGSNITSLVNGTLLYFEPNGTFKSINNTFYGNTFNRGKWVQGNNDSSNVFNTTGQGNYYWNVSSYTLSDSNSDGWADGGTSYPFNQTTLGINVWNGTGTDWFPYSGVGAGCTTPIDNLNINTSTVLCSGTYYLNDTGNDGIINLQLGKGNYTLTCLGTKLIGNTSGRGIVGQSGASPWRDNVTIEGCAVSNYSTNVLLQYFTNSTFKNLNLSYATYENIYFQGVKKILIDNITSSWTKHTTYGHGVYFSADTNSSNTVNITLKNSIFYNNSGNAIHINGINNTWVFNLSVYNTYIYGGEPANGAPMCINDYACKYCNFYNNTIYGGESGLRMSSDAAYPNSWLYSGSKYNNVYNNTFINNYWYNILISQGALGNNIYNNEFLQNNSYTAEGVPSIWFENSTLTEVNSYVNISNHNSSFKVKFNRWTTNAYILFNYTGNTSLFLRNNTVNITNQNNNYPYNDLYNISSGAVISNNFNTYSVPMIVSASYAVGNYQSDVANVTISSVVGTRINNESFRITWTTNIPTNTTIKYGTTTALIYTKINTSFSTSHTEYITGLLPNTLYYYNITAYNSSTSYNTSGGYSITTNETFIPTIISNVTSEVLSTTSIRVNWTTNIKANETVRYGTTLALSSSKTNTSFGTAHSMTITGLTVNTLYYFNITSYNSSTSYNTSGGYSIYTYSTTGNLTFDGRAMNRTYEYGTTASVNVTLNNSCLDIYMLGYGVGYDCVNGSRIDYVNFENYTAIDYFSDMTTDFPLYFRKMISDVFFINVPSYLSVLETSIIGVKGSQSVDITAFDDWNKTQTSKTYEINSSNIYILNVSLRTNKILRYATFSVQSNDLSNLYVDACNNNNVTYDVELPSTFYTKTNVFIPVDALNNCTSTEDGITTIPIALNFTTGYGNITISDVIFRPTTKSYPSDIAIDVNNDSATDFQLYGELIGSTGIVNTFNGGSSTVDVTMNSSGKKSEIVNFTVTNGLQHTGFSFYITSVDSTDTFAEDFSTTTYINTTSTTAVVQPFWNMVTQADLYPGVPTESWIYSKPLPTYKNITYISNIVDDEYDGLAPIYYYISADCGAHWTDMDRNAVVVFGTSGDCMMWKARLATDGSTYGYIYNIQFSGLGYIPANVSLDVGNEGTADYISPYYDGSLTRVTIDADVINDYIETCTTPTCTIPINVTFYNKGTLRLSSLSVQYNTDSLSIDGGVIKAGIKDAKTTRTSITTFNDSTSSKNFNETVTYYIQIPDNVIIKTANVSLTGGYS